MNHPEVYAMFKRVKKRAVRLGFPDNVRIYPHKFRHAFATRMASRIQQPVLEKIMGWEKGTRMTGTYTHLNNEDVAIAIYEANGLKAPVRKE
jgi:integrase